ncbi:MAG: hypothetical protein APR53_04435 [Methanoculleus sp. SDB]|nr:MAG: hypothetical protein APR53_04435 [Methanoculleus sp. SDB]
MRKTCCLFPVASGVPIIGLGLFLLLACIVPMFIEDIPLLPTPVLILFAVFGLVCIGAGIRRHGKTWQQRHLSDPER